MWFAGHFFMPGADGQDGELEGVPVPLPGRGKGAIYWGTDIPSCNTRAFLEKLSAVCQAGKLIRLK